MSDSSKFDSLLNEPEGDTEPGGVEPGPEVREVPIPPSEAQGPYGLKPDRGPHANVPDEDLTQEQEQEIRDYFGYAASETRTRAERDATAKRIVAKGTPNLDLPPDIEAVWGEGRVDGSGQPASVTAKILIEAWGVETFRTSAIHLAAIYELKREANMREARQDTVKNPLRYLPEDNTNPEPEDPK